MRLDIHHYIHFANDNQQGELMSQISDAIDALETKITNLTTVEQSAVALLNGLAQQIRDNANAPAKLNELAAKIDSDASDLASAVSANTPTA
jgi:ATP adenylyltransferase/5',5'''-P-1,P-4-tetraphosphate phosphorylase II